MAENAVPGPSSRPDDGDASFSDDSEPNSRSVYMITYSKADLTKVPTKERFVELIFEAFHRTGTARIIQYICCIERHKDGAPHYHMCIKFDKQKKWKAARKYLADKKGINLNFRDTFSNYYAGYLYASKEDKEFILSDGHPNLANPPRTDAATEARRQGGARNRRRSFDALDLSDLIVREKIRTKIDLLRLCHKQKSEGKRDVACYVLSNIDRCVKMIDTTWEMEGAEGLIERSKLSRLEILQKALQASCNQEGCNWLEMAQQTLTRNDIAIADFAGSVKDTLLQGRGKERNILITGPANCGKTFIFQPLTVIYKVFVNPATGSFAWVGVEDAELIYLNDFRWNEKIISWQDLLRLLEGDSVHFPAPKTHYAKDILLSRDTPIFATSIGPIRRYQNVSMGQEETRMMEVRWKIYKFHHQISTDQMLDATPCGKCFAKLILEN